MREACPYNVYKRNTKRFGQREIEEVFNDINKLDNLSPQYRKEKIIEIRCFIETECFDIFCGLGELDPYCMKTCILQCLSKAVDKYKLNESLARVMGIINAEK